MTTLHKSAPAAAKSRPRPARPPFVITPSVTGDQKRLIGEHLTALAQGRVRVEFQPGMYSTYPGTDVRIPGTEGHLWLIDLSCLLEDPAADFSDDTPIFDDRAGDVRLLAAAELDKFAAILTGIASDFRADVLAAPGKAVAHA